MVIGFDMVQEEDYTPGIKEFLPKIFAAKKKAKETGTTFDLYLHAGESNSSQNQEVYDAVLIGSKRIGHGYHLAYHPSMIKKVK